MTLEQFWTIIEETRDGGPASDEKKLVERLSGLEEREVIAFQRFWKEHFSQLYDWRLWGVAYLALGGCSDDSFIDWRNWVIACGREAFETAVERPDDLVPWIDADGAAGCEGIGYAAGDALSAKNPKWKNAHPVHEGLSHPKDPRGPTWKTKGDLQALLPKTYARYETEATELEKKVRDPEYVAELYGAARGEAQEFRPMVEEVEIDGQKGTRLTLVPVEKKKPWWKFWA